MKKPVPIHRNLWKVMKITLSQLLLLALFGGIALAHDSRAQEVLNRTVTLNQKNLELKDALRQIEREAKVKFVYSTRIQSGQRISLNVTNRKLSAVLDELLTPVGIYYEVIENRILLTKRRPNRSSLADPEFIQNQAEITTDRTVSGLVIDEVGVPIPGVNVAVKGITRGTTTAADGRYSLVVPENSTLIYSFVGLQSREVRVSNQSVIDVTLLPDPNQLQEVQVVAYGEQRKRDVTGSIASVKAAEISMNTAASPEVALQGRAAGVQITQAGGSPGGAVRINVRGVASISSDSQPLIVIDGQPVNSSAFGTGGVAMNPLAEINPEDIASMEVLKDASAAILYGSRAANGVILITTKRGKGKPKLDLSYQQGVSTPTNRVDFVDNGADYFNILKRAAANNPAAGLPPQSTNLVNLLPTGILKGTLAPALDNQLVDSTTLYNTSTNWLDQTLRNGQYTQASLSVSGGTKKLSVFASGAYYNEGGIVIGQDLRRLSGRLNIDYKPIKMLQIGGNLSLNGLNNSTVPLGNTYRAGLTNALPAYPVQLPDGTYFNGISNGTNNRTAIGTNPVFFRNNYSNDTKTLRAINTFHAQLTPIAGLVLRSEYGFDYQRSRNASVFNQTLYPLGIDGAERDGNGKAENRNIINRNSNWNNTINYTRELSKDHRINVLLGNSVQSRIGDNETYITEGVPEGAKEGIDTTRSVVFNNELSFRFVSFFGRVNYTFKDRYLIEASLRSDGSSRFGPENRWATFPAASVGWIASEEDFLKGSSFVNFLKLRASYGLTGNAEIGNFAWQKTFTFVGYNAAIYGGLQGGQFTNPGNSGLTWESTAQFDIGADFRLFKDRISGTFDFYNKVSDGLLLDYNIGNFYGTINRSMTINLGSVRNRGVELSLTSRNITRNDFRWTSDFNISGNRNEVLSTYDAPFLRYPAQIIDGTNIATPGYPLGNYYIARFAGFDPATGNELFYERDNEVNRNTGQTVETGQKLDGTAGNNVGNGNQFILENRTPYPTMFGGLNNTFDYKGFDLSILFYFQTGNWIYDQAERAQSYPNEGQVLRANVVDVGNLVDQLDGSDGLRLLQYRSNARNFESTRFLQKGDFVRLKNLQLGYRFPSEFTEKLRLRQLRVYLTGQNLLTFTKFRGWDPEVFRSGGAGSASSNLSPGITNNDLPQVRTFLFGLNIGL